MDATEKKQFIRQLTAFPWTGQAVENFYNPRSSWRHEETLAQRFLARSNCMVVFVNCFRWGRSPQGVDYWSIISDRVILPR